jgi:5-methylcytosine-specific restriction endonuclease McrA
MKTCSKCGESKPLEDFNKNRAIKDGLDGKCRKCKKAYNFANKERNAATNTAWATANKGRKKETNSLWHTANKEKVAVKVLAWRLANLDRKAAQSVAWRQANRERNNSNQLAWAAANKEKVAATKASYAKANPEKRIQSQALRRARNMSNGVKLVTGNEIATITAMPCTACGVAGPSQVDHIVPINRGGAHTIGNLMPLCPSCNASKCDLLYIEWKYSNRPQAKKVFAA